ncbi:hypothetical protein HanRHA438_Chr16g0750861 [Helianthus annuus]|nr:hypothetical protein HanRHA438_Chr16g0750861 [Helianthus annuus]
MCIKLKSRDSNSRPNIRGMGMGTRMVLKRVDMGNPFSYLCRIHGDLTNLLSTCQRVQEFNMFR